MSEGCEDLRLLRRRAYADLRGDRPELFSNTPDSAVRIEFGQADQDAVADELNHRMSRAGLPSGYGDTGVVYQDDYLILVRDAVRFPDGRLGSYIRLLPAAMSGGAVVLPLLGDRVLVVRHFRHATRTWLWELPRGFADPGEAAVRTASRELEEELRLKAAELVRLGTVHPDSGTFAAAVEIFAARVAGQPVPERAEGIDDVRVLTPGEFDAWIAEGRIRDGFTLAAWAMARARGLLPQTPAAPAN